MFKRFSGSARSAQSRTKFWSSVRGWVHGSGEEEGAEALGSPRVSSGSEVSGTFVSTMSATKFNAVFERDEAGFIYAHVPELPEVQTQGRTLEEAREMVRAAIGQALELRQERGEPVPAEGWAATELVDVG